MEEILLILLGSVCVCARACVCGVCVCLCVCVLETCIIIMYGQCDNFSIWKCQQLNIT